MSHEISRMQLLARVAQTSCKVHYKLDFNVNSIVRALQGNHPACLPMRLNGHPALSAAHALCIKHCTACEILSCP